MDKEKVFLLNQIMQNMQLKLKETGLVVCGKDWINVKQFFQYDSIGYVKKGTIYMEVNGRGMEVKTGGMYYIPSMYCFSHHSFCVDTEVYYMHFEMGNLGKILLEKIEIPVAVYPDNPQRIDRLFERIQNSKNARVLGAPLRTTGFVFEVVASFFEFCEEQTILINTKKVEQMMYIIEYIRNNLGKNLTVEILAAQVGLAPTYFIKIFQQFFHETPMNFVLKQREKAACNLLENSEMSIKEIGVSLGFLNQNYFSEFFKKRNGFSPSEYRNLKRKSL